MTLKLKITNSLNSNEFVFVRIIKKENNDSGLASLSENLLKNIFKY